MYYIYYENTIISLSMTGLDYSCDLKTGFVKNKNFNKKREFFN